MLPILNSRKCYWGRCKFCTIHESWDPKARQKTADDAFKEIVKIVEETGIRDFRFVDEASPPNLLFDLSKLILKATLEISFEIYAIAEKRFLNTEFVAALGKAGCKQVYFGLENIDPDAAIKLGKKINQSLKMDDIFRLCSDNGIHVYAYTLFGYPDVEKSSEDDTVEFIINCQHVHTATVASFVPVIGSPFAEDYQGRTKHAGGLTEDFSTFLMEDGTEVPISEMGNQRAKNALSRILKSRSDLALTTRFNDETRYTLSKRFGPSFAQTAASLASDEFKDTTINKAIRERIQRAL